jgi:hypothetical protein
VNEKKLKLNDAGKMITKVFLNLPKFYNGMTPDTYIVMPNHFHGIIIIDPVVGASLCGRPELENHISRSNEQIIISKNIDIIQKINNKYFGLNNLGRAPRKTGSSTETRP